MKKTKGQKTFAVFNYTLMILIALIMIFPYLNTLAKSFNDSNAAGTVYLIPKAFTWINYKTLLSDSSLWQSVKITLARILFGVPFSLILRFTCGYALSRKFWGKSFIVLFYMIPTFITAGEIPLYVLYSQTGLINNFLLYVFVGGFTFFDALMIRTYIQSTVPESLHEAAILDGANEFRVMAQVVLPMCKPILATVALWTMVAHWNDWTTTLYYMRNQNLSTLAYKMMQLVKESERIAKLMQQAQMLGQGAENIQVPSSEALISAQVIISTLPIICVYPFLQKYFVKGITVGSVKG